MKTLRIGTLMLALAAVSCGPAGGAEDEDSERMDAEAEASPEASAPSPAPPATVTVARGTQLTLTLNQRISTRDNQAGDPFTGTVDRAVTEGDRVLLPRGATVHGTVTAVQKPDGEVPALIKLELDRIEARGESVPIDAVVLETSPGSESEMTGEAKKIGGGAAVGALIGGIVGGGAKEALIGAAAGAAAGTAVTLGTRDQHGFLAQGSPMTVRLEGPLTLPAPGG